MEEDFEYVLQLEKLESTDPNRLIIAGMASTGVIDHDGERIDMDSLRGQFDKYMKNPVIRFMHGKDNRNPDAIGKVIPEFTDAKGKVWKTEFRKNGPFIIAEISNADDVKSIRTKIAEKNLRGLSIGGRAKRTKVYDPEIEKDINSITVMRWNETSVVDLPANPEGFFEVLKMACTGANCPLDKGDSKSSLEIEDYNPEKHYKELIKEGYSEVEAKVSVYTTERLINDATYDKERAIDDEMHYLMSTGHDEESAEKKARKIMDSFMTVNSVKKDDTFMDYKEINSGMQDYIEKLEHKIQDMRFIYDHMTEESQDTEEVVKDENNEVLRFEIDLSELI